MRTLVKMEFGSVVYGTNLPTSDKDYKGIIVPDADDILLQTAPKTSVSTTTKKDPTAKNTAEDVDTEFYSLQGFVRLCDEGQTAALDMLFTPPQFWIKSSPEWEFIQKNKSALIHRGTNAFIGYCLTQAAKYGVKGSYLASLEATINLLKSFPLHDRLSQHEAELRRLAEQEEQVSIIQIQNPKTLKSYDYLQIRKTKAEFNVTVKYAIDMFERMYAAYGQRALAAKTNLGVDWKAVMHALRVLGEARELLATGHITLPRPEAEFLKEVRQGRIPYAQVEELIEEGMAEIDKLNETSTLPESINKKFWKAYVKKVYREEVVGRNFLFRTIETIRGLGTRIKKATNKLKI